MDLESRSRAVQETFDRIRRDVFEGDPICNEHLDVEVLEAAEVRGIDTMAVITPWSIIGICFPGEDVDLPDDLMVGLRPRRLLFNELPTIGRYASITLASDCEPFADMEAAREVVRRIAPAFRAALEREIEDATVERPDRRELLRGRVPGG